MTNAPSVGEYFSEMSSQYDALITRYIPPYAEMFEMLFLFLTLDQSKPIRILDMGCGSGNLSFAAAKLYPHCTLTMVDLSTDMLKLAEAKLQDKKPTMLNQNFLDLNFPEGSFDLVMGSYSLHHLTDAEKAEVYKRIFTWLAPGGNFRCADGVYTLPMDSGPAKVAERWAEWCRSVGTTDEEIQLWVDHEKQYDHYTSLRQHIAWLESAGFIDNDCFWKKYLGAVFGGNKP